MCATHQPTLYYFSSNTDDEVYTVGMINVPLTVAPQQSHNPRFALYKGPAIGENLATVAPYLGLTVDYGWLWFISKGLFWVIKHFYQVFGNWGGQLSV
jgi:YidC/Oxa1 family membrane protein insertase